MKSRIITGIMVAVSGMALLSLTACDALGGGSEGVSQQLVQVERGDISISVTGSGSIETSHEARLAFGSSGKVDEILVEEGDRVSKGQVLARLDTRALELAREQSQVAVTQAEVALNQAQLNQKTAEYNLTKIRDSKDSLELAVLNAQINVDTAEDNLADTIRNYGWDDFDTIEAELNKAKAFYDSVQKRLRDTATGEADDWLLLLENAKDRLDTAQAAYDNFVAGHGNEKINLKKQLVEVAKKSLGQSQKDLDDLAEDIAMQELQVEAAGHSVTEAQQSLELAGKSLDEAQRQLDEATITAPFEGMVAQVLVKEGDNIPSPSMAPTTVVYLIDPDQMEVIVEVDEIDIPLLELNQEAVISVDALPGAEFKGTVTSVHPVPKEVGGVVLYDVKLELNVPGNSRIKVGMRASADVMIEQRNNVLIIPSRAVTKNSQGQTTVKVMSGKEVEERPVVIGLDDGLRAEVVSGLQEGETVVIEVRTKSTSMSMF